MDKLTNDHPQVIPALAFSEHTLKLLKTAAGWAKFISIIGFVFVGLIVLGGLISGIALSFMGDSMGMGIFPFPSFIFGFVYLIVAILYFFPVYYLYKFATKASQAISTLNSKNLEMAVLNLKSYFKFIGILIIVTLALYVIGIIVMIFGLSFFQSQLPHIQ